jgi:hypothetical protein
MCLTSEGMSYLECMCRFYLRECVHPTMKVVDVAVSCMYSVVYVFLRRWKKSFYLSMVCYELNLVVW